jgi:hypothetical protein
MEDPNEAKYSGLLLKSAVAAIVISVVLVFLFPQYRLDFILILVGLLMGAVTAFYLYHSFSAPPRELIFPEGEQVVKKNVDGKIYLTIPMTTGGFIGKTAPATVNLYLTNRAIVAEPTELSAFDEEGRYFVFSIPLLNIVNFKPEKKLFAEYIRLTFVNTSGINQEILLHTDTETHEWVDAISRALQ